MFLLFLLIGLFGSYLYFIFSGPPPAYRKYLRPGYSLVEDLKAEGKYESLYPEKEWWLSKDERNGVDEEVESGMN